MNIDIDKCTKGKVLGRGMNGTTCLAKCGKTQYALKVQRLWRGYVKKSSVSPYWREIEFAERVANKYPKYFTKLYGYDIIYGCDHVQKYKYPFELILPKYQKKFKETAESPYCARFLYALVDGDVESLIKKVNLTHKQYSSMIYQLIDIIDILKKYGYKHTDTNPGNIGYRKTDKKGVYEYVLIDYGSILHSKYIMDNNDRMRWRRSDDMFSIMNILIFNPIWDYISKNKIKINTYEQDVERFKKSSYRALLSKYTNNIHLQLLLFNIVFPGKFQEFVLGNKNPEKIKFIPKLGLPIEDILFIASNFNESSKIKDYLRLKYFN